MKAKSLLNKNQTKSKKKATELSTIYKPQKPGNFMKALRKLVHSNVDFP